MRKTAFAVCILAIACFIATYVFADCGVCDKEKYGHEAKGSGNEKKGSSSCYDEVSAIAAEKGGVREITYEQFQKIRSSGEKYVLVDVLSNESYDKGHIEGAISFPCSTIDYQTAPKLLKKIDKIIVYCSGFKCSASTKAAHRLQALGYKNVVDYKGGLEEWQAKANKLAK